MFFGIGVVVFVGFVDGDGEFRVIVGFVSNCNRSFGFMMVFGS